MPDIWSAHLVLSLLLDESLASAGLRALGITREWIAAGNLGPEVAESEARADILQPAAVDGPCEMAPGGIAANVREASDPDELTRILDRAAAIRRLEHDEGGDGISSTHLLVAVVETSEFIRGRLSRAGVLPADIRRETGCETGDRLPPIPAEFRLQLSPEADFVAVPSGTAAQRPFSESRPACAAVLQGAVRSQDEMAVWRVIDANLNRAREGLRVLEDHARFIGNDAERSRELKDLRHGLVQSESRLKTGYSGFADGRAILRYRDTPHDVGTELTNAAEVQRQSPRDIVTANCRRVQESLRSLEEFGKLVSVAFSAEMKQLRYRAYELERVLQAGSGSAETTGQALSSPSLRLTERRHRLQAALLCVLVTESACRRPWKQFVQEILSGGADVLQLREKDLPDRELVERARWLSGACRDAGALCIINDRPEVAALSVADGVHLGQDEIAPRDARRILASDQLLGISTHDVTQARAAVEAGADYLGVGPVFPSLTKAFAQFPGLSFVNEVSREFVLPWFAIGGVTLSRLPDLCQAGARRVAVSSALAAADCPADATRLLLEQLRKAGSDSDTGQSGTQRTCGDV